MRASGRPLALVRAGRARETLHLAKSFGILHYVRTRTALRKRGSLTRSTDVWSVVLSEEAPSVRRPTAAYMSSDRGCHALRNNHVSELATQSTKKREGLDGTKAQNLESVIVFLGRSHQPQASAVAYSTILSSSQSSLRLKWYHIQSAIRKCS